MVRWILLLCFVFAVVVAGCSWSRQTDLPVSIFAETPFSSAEAEESEIVADLYAYTEYLRGFDKTELREEYETLTAEASPECKKYQTCLKLAWLLSGVEPSLADYDKALALLDKSLAESPGSLLKGYIYELRYIVERNKMLSGKLKATRYKMLMERREGKLLREKIDALNTEIKTLEMKIEALTSIEQSLKDIESNGNE